MKPVNRRKNKNMKDEKTETPSAPARATKPIKIAIQDNDCSLPATCPVCGSVFEPDTGPQLFQAGTPEPVCERCSKIHSPQLFALWQHAQKQRAELESKRHELLVEAAKKPIRKLIQFDCFFDSVGDDVTISDQDDDALFSATVFDLRNMDCLRVTLPVGTKREDALRGLGKIVQWIRSDPQALITPETCDVPF
jgi:hypothetical protein